VNSPVPTQWRSAITLFLQGLFFGIIALVGVVAVFTRVVHANATTVGFVLLLVVLAVATARGLAAASVISLAGMLCFNFFFLPPVGRFTIADPENWIALFAFLVTALVASHLSNRAQQQAWQARRSQRETEQLYALSRAILLTEANRPIGLQAAQSIAQIFELPSVTILDSKSASFHRGGAVEMASDERLQLEGALHEVARQGRRQATGDIQILPIALGGNPIGALAVQGINASDGAIQSTVNLVAIALERVRTEEAARRAEASRRSEEFKSTLLDAIAHEFKTPLTSIKAAATGLRIAQSQLASDQRELAAIIEEETDRLSQLVTEAFKMAEVDAGRTTPKPSSVHVSDLFHTAKNSFEGRGGERIQILETHGARIWADRDLIALALRQLIDNALKYSGAHSSIRLDDVAEDSCLVLRVADDGPGIPEPDRDRIFDKFYRRANASQTPGTGLGLHIAREIARIHGGDLRIGEGIAKGAIFCLSLPIAKEGSA
jgi:two-component system, OmpR family, sensor histidine kinase KdpD